MLQGLPTAATGNTEATLAQFGSRIPLNSREEFPYEVFKTMRPLQDSDIVVPCLPQELTRGIDAQLDRGITEVLRLRHAEPPVEPAFGPVPARTRAARTYEVQQRRVTPEALRRGGPIFGPPRSYRPFSSASHRSRIPCASTCAAGVANRLPTYARRISSSSVLPVVCR